MEFKVVNEDQAPRLSGGGPKSLTKLYAAAERLKPGEVIVFSVRTTATKDQNTIGTSLRRRFGRGAFSVFVSADKASLVIRRK